MNDRTVHDVGRLIRAVRRHLEMTQESLAHLAAVSKSTIEAIETGRGKPRNSTINSVIVALRADQKIFSSAFLGDALLAIRLLAPMNVGDLIPLFEEAQTGDSQPPDISDVRQATIGRDACLFFRQLVDIYQETPVHDRSVYLRELMDLFDALRAHGWIARIGCYKRTLGNSDKTETVGVLRFFPTRCDGAIAIISCPAVARVSNASVVELEN